MDDSTKTVSEVQTVLHVSDCGIATSGNYRNFYYVDGRKVSHTIDPKNRTTRAAQFALRHCTYFIVRQIRRSCHLFHGDGLRARKKLLGEAQRCASLFHLRRRTRKIQSLDDRRYAKTHRTLNMEQQFIDRLSESPLFQGLTMDDYISINEQVHFEFRYNFPWHGDC